NGSPLSQHPYSAVVRSQLADKGKNRCNGKVNATLFLFDLSGSMNEAGANSQKSKLQQAKDASRQTLNALRSNPSGLVEEVAVLGFSGGCVADPTRVVSGFETDLSLVESRIDAMSAGGGTPLAEAIAASECKLAAHLAQTGQDKGKLIILSDGQATCQPIRPNGAYNSGQLGQQIVTVSAGQCGGLQRPSLKYYTIGFNIAPGSPAERDLQYLAQISGGKYLNVQNQTQLERAFRKFNRTYIPKPYPALSNLPPASNSQFRKGVSQAGSESFAAALESFEAFAQLHEGDCHGAYNLALMQEANDLYRDAIANYQQYLALCPDAADRAFVEGQILFLEEEFQAFLLFQKEAVKSDLEYLKLHFEKIQNGQSLALAEEFKGFLKEKGDYYHKLPELLGRTERLFKSNAREVARGLENCAKTINRNPQSWDRDATPFLSMTYLNLERLLASF
ncbi:MAG TPA: VWA domain-containing protein, partial [Saprospiraceae bacterium]|nr:VWA domain-containing protein [Saprospiraceae bacterium]